MNIEISDYGITLVKLREEHLEMLRGWRNSEYVRKHMVYQSHITEEMQKEWFRNIGSGMFFLIKTNNEYIGLVNSKDVDFETRTAEGGIFLIDAKYTESGIALAASILMADFFFDVMGMVACKATILKSNPAAINYDKQLGYVITSEDEHCYHAILTKESHKKKTDKVKKVLRAGLLMGKGV